MVSALVISNVSVLIARAALRIYISKVSSYDRLNQSKHDTKASCVSETITMSTCVRLPYRQPGSHAYYDQSISALAIRIFSALFSRAALAIRAKKILIARAALAIV